MPSTIAILVSIVVTLRVLSLGDALMIGDSGCVVGYVMDRYCVDRGTLFDNPTVVTLQEPQVHSVHCLIDVPNCLASPYEILTDPPSGSDMFVRAWTLSSSAKEAVLAVARAEGVCGTCSGTI